MRVDVLRGMLPVALPALQALGDVAWGFAGWRVPDAGPGLQDWPPRCLPPAVGEIRGRSLRALGGFAGICLHTT